MRAWIGGPAWDLALVWGGAPVAVAAGVVALARPDLVVPLWLAWLLLVDGPHLAATYTRTYLDARVRRERLRLLAGSLLWLAPGFVALAAAEASGRSAPFDAFLALALLWSVHHNVRQHYGILAIYERHARAGAWARARDVWFTYAMLWGLFAVFLLAHGTSFPTTVPLAVLGALTLAYIIDVARRGGDLRPPLYVLIPAVGVQAFALQVVGARPLVAGTNDPEMAFLAVSFVGGMVHGMQYLGVVLAANRRRDGRSRALLAYGAFLVASLAYVALNQARMPAVPGTRVLLALYWGLFFHHYYLDQKIWRPHADAAVRAELGLA